MEVFNPVFAKVSNISGEVQNYFTEWIFIIFKLNAFEFVILSETSIQIFVSGLVNDLHWLIQRPSEHQTMLYKLK